MHSRVATFIAALVLASVPAAIGEVSQGQAAEGWLRLFDGQSQFGWTSSSPSGAGWHAGAGVLVSDPTQPGAIRTTTSFSDFDLKFEARITGPGATLLFRADPQSKPAQPGFSLSLSDGSIANLSSSPAAASSDWSTYELIADGTHVTASINGRVTADDKSGKNRVGYFEFTFPSGTRVEIRSIALKPLNLDSLYNGSNLDGWKAVSAPAPESKSKIHLPLISGKPKAPPAVRWTGQGTIHGQGGVGQLESSLAYDDFILQFAARASGKDSQRGAEVFFRATPGQFDTGYAISAVSDPHEAYGPGSLFKLQKSRGASIALGKFFVGTLVARAHRFSVWINGALVTDYYDSRPDGTYHSAAGPLGFRLQNDKVGIDFRDVRATTLPKGPEPPPAPVVATAPAPAIAPAQAIAPPAAAAPPPVIFPGQSPQEKANQEQIRKLTVDALNASTPEEAIRINKQILVLDPSDMPAQQRLDKAQAQIDSANAQREHGREQQQASAAQLASNAQRRDQLLSQAQDDLLAGHLIQANDRLNDAQRLGAAGPEFDRLHSLIASRIRNRILVRIGLGGTGIVALTWAVIYWFRRRNSALAAFLVALDGVNKGKRYALNQEVTHIGGIAMDGGKKNEVLVHDPDRQVSRFHCEVHKRGNSCYLVDLASSNGTYLRHRPLQPGIAARLRDGDKFTLANSVAFELRIERQRAS